MRAPPRRHGRPIPSGKGVCRDYAHLAITFCRCMNIPARYCTGYLGDIGTPPACGAEGFRRLVRGLSRRALAHVRSAQQHAAHRPGADRAGTRCRRCRDHADVRAEHAGRASRSGPTRSRTPRALRRRCPAAAPVPAPAVPAGRVLEYHRPRRAAPPRRFAAASRVAPSAAW